MLPWQKLLLHIIYKYFLSSTFYSLKIYNPKSISDNILWIRISGGCHNTYTLPLDSNPTAAPSSAACTHASAPKPCKLFSLSWMFLKCSNQQVLPEKTSSYYLLPVLWIFECILGLIVVRKLLKVWSWSMSLNIYIFVSLSFSWATLCWKAYGLEFYRVY